MNKRKRQANVKHQAILGSKPNLDTGTPRPKTNHSDALISLFAKHSVSTGQFCLLRSQLSQGRISLVVPRLPILLLIVKQLLSNNIFLSISPSDYHVKANFPVQVLTTWCFFFFFCDLKVFLSESSNYVVNM